jgi:hypothetical protein
LPTRDEVRERGLTADQTIAAYKRAVIRRRFPGQYLSATLDIIEADAAQGKRAAQTALKLLFDRRFDK